MNCQRRRSAPSSGIDAASTPTRTARDPGRLRPVGPLLTAAPSASPATGTRPAPDRHAAPDGPAAPARRAVVIGLQPAANGRGYGLCV